MQPIHHLPSAGPTSSRQPARIGPLDTSDLIFRIANWLVLPGWAALALAPLARRRLVAFARWMAALAAGLYVTLLVQGLAGGGAGLPPDAGFTSLAAVEALFSARSAVLGGWVHLLAFDLFVGTWMAEEAPRRQVPHWALVPMLFLTLMAGPLGLLLFLVTAGLTRLVRRV